MLPRGRKLVLSRRLRRTSGMHAQAVRDRSGPQLAAPAGPGGARTQSPVSRLENPKPKTEISSGAAGTKVEEIGANGHNGAKEKEGAAPAPEAAPKEQAAS